MSAYWKATRPNGLDFRTGTIDYAGALATGEPVMHPTPDLHGGASSYLSVATVPTDCTGFRWPCRLFRVEPVGEHVADGSYPNKVRVTGLRVIEERPAHEVFGPNGPAVVAVIERAGRLTREEAESLAAAWDAAWDAARYAARDAARDAAWEAALAELARDLITPDQYEALIGPWRSVTGGAS